MPTFEDIYKIIEVEGVDQYILVNEHGLINHNYLDPPEKIVQVLFSSMKHTFTIAKNRFKYIKFARKNNNDIYVFPIGKYCLGVLKHETVSEEVFQCNMIEFLNRLIKM